MNLNKFSKAELISKLKEFKNNSENQSKLLNSFYIIKQFIVKFTLLALIIKIFKRFRILRRIWLIINATVMTIWGISVMDLYGLSFISAFYVEIISITGNIVNYLTNTKFYFYLSNLLGYKTESPSRFEPLKTIQQATTRIEPEVKRDSRIPSWFEKEQEIIEEDKPFYTNKCFIYGTFLLISGLTYYYFGDEIKLCTISIWEWLRGRRPGDNPPPINPPVNPSSESTRMNPIATFFGLNKNKDPKGVTFEEILDEDVIEVINSAGDSYFK
jgi:hypothetical protein